MPTGAEPAMVIALYVHKKEMNFFQSDFCDCLLAAHHQTACAVCSSQPMQIEKMIKLLSLVS